LCARFIGLLGDTFTWLGRYGRWVLPVGLLVGLSLPAAAEPMRAAIPWCIALLLIVACLRIDVRPSELLGAMPQVARLVVILQLLMPLLLAGLLWLVDCPAAWRMPAVLVAAAAPISGSPNLVSLLGEEPTLALRTLIVGTALMPLTCIPVLYVLDPSQSAASVLQASLTLLAVIGIAIVLASLIRRYWLREATRQLHAQLDGIAALLLAIVVVGLMSAIHGAWDRPKLILGTLLLAIVINIGLQCLGIVIARLSRQPQRITVGVISGNRNIALYLTALPGVFTEPLLLFIACYQVPMYLTPLVGGLFYRRLGENR